MASGVRDHGGDLSRRTFLGTMAGGLGQVAAGGLLAPAMAGTAQPKRGGTLRFATRSDATGLDPHRNNFYPVSMSLAALCQGLLDLNHHSEPVPGIATGWEASKDLLTYTFPLRQGVLFHNGRDVDAAAVKWNFERIKNPQTSSAFARTTLENLHEIVIVDKYTVRCHLHQPSAAFPADVVYYPCNLIATESDAQADTHPIGCGPFKFVRWERNSITELVRFEHYFETDGQGHSLPYLERIIGRPKKEDPVRLTALRTGEVDLIDSMAYVDAAEFLKKHPGKFQSWEVPTVGTSFIIFNLDNGPFTDKRVRQAAAHAIDRTAIMQAVFYGRGEAARSFYAAASPWHTPGVKAYPEHDPDKAKFLLRQARAIGTEVLLQAEDAYPYIQQTGELLQAMWSDAGFKVKFDILSAPVLRQKRRDRAFHADSMAASYRFDPDGWFSRQLLSTSPMNKENSGFRHEKVDQLIAAARTTAEKPKRLELYTEIDSIVNEELPILYLHHLTLLEAASPKLQGYRPAISRAFSVRGGGIRTAWIA